MQFHPNWKISSLLVVSSLLTSACIDLYSGSNSSSYSYFTFEGDAAFCNDIDYTFDESNMSNFECVEPVYMSFAAFQSSAKIELLDPKRIEQPGKLYAYKNHLYSVDHLKGIAVWELNLEQTNQIGYIELPNVTDIAIRNDYLYANSYTDLVQINLNDFNQAPIRIQNVFEVAVDELIPELPNATYFNRSQVNVENGYIIGYKQAGSNNTVFFGE
ncbi:MAG: hypothetical protein HRU38_02495 [Saccharospirillaceae bacterium]|nr:hypothetical protein [Pseudomonadales bacterium]NRB77530.1 hypothetical protein [Saccharospirillaceae bacterium]